jgi:hypothetical protein
MTSNAAETPVSAFFKRFGEFVELLNNDRMQEFFNKDPELMLDYHNKLVSVKLSLDALRDSLNKPTTRDKSPKRPVRAPVIEIQDDADEDKTLAATIESLSQCYCATSIKQPFVRCHFCDDRVCAHCVYHEWQELGYHASNDGEPSSMKVASCKSCLRLEAKATPKGAPRGCGRFYYAAYQAKLRDEEQQFETTPVQDSTKQQRELQYSTTLFTLCKRQLDCRG